MTAERSRQRSRTAPSSRPWLIYGAARSPTQQRYGTHACQQQAAPKHRRSIQHDLLRNHSAQRVSEHIAAFDTEAVEKCERVARHSRHRLRHRSRRPADTSVVEQK